MSEGKAGAELLGGIIRDGAKGGSPLAKQVLPAVRVADRAFKRAEADIGSTAAYNLREAAENGSNLAKKALDHK
jgi:hypothetical protein